MTKSPHILVVGGAHLDIRASAQVKSYSERQDAAGSVEYAIGGCAYNVAWNLICNRGLLEDFGVTVTLASSTNPSSIDGRIVRDKISSLGFDFLDLGAIEPSSGYVAHVQLDGTKVAHTKAVTSSAVTDVRIDATAVESEVRKARLVFCDTNMSVSALRELRAVAGRHRKPFVVGVASDDKASRVVEAANEHKTTDFYAAVCMNHLEAQRIARDFGLGEGDIRKLREALRAEVLFVTLGQDGCDVVKKGSNEIVRLEAVSSQADFNPVGAGDALAAAVCKWLAQSENLEIANDTLGAMVRGAVLPILKTKHATADAAVLLDKSLRGWSIDTWLLFASLLVTALLGAMIGYFQEVRHGLLVSGFLVLSWCGGLLGCIARQALNADDLALLGRRSNWSKLVLGSGAGLIGGLGLLAIQVAWFTGLDDIKTIIDSLTRDPTRPMLVAAFIGAVAGYNYTRVLPFLRKGVD